jgi:ring-1,2-phenylacetyl-CoA epoxidase subunit PaaC
MDASRPQIKSTNESDSLISYTLHLADNALILGHRNSEWTGHGPILEQDIAISNIALDLVGQARNFYQYAAGLINSSRNRASHELGHSAKVVTEDDLAYLRDVREFKNCLLAEQENGDWAHTVLRQFFFSAYQFQLYSKLQQSNDQILAAISEKALKEVTYHLRWSSEWVIRLGDGTSESRDRILNALDALWKFTRELFIPCQYELTAEAEQYGVDPVILESAWRQNIHDVFEEAGILGALPPETGEVWIGLCGKEGTHSEYLGYILAEMQFLQRAYPGCDW